MSVARMSNMYYSRFVYPLFRIPRLSRTISMKKLLLPVMIGAMSLAAPASKAAEANMPDCVGLRPGMTVAEARERLKAYDAKLEVGAIELQIPGLDQKPVLGVLYVARKPTPDPKGKINNAPATVFNAPAPVSSSDAVETVRTEITLPPNKPVVWKVVRSLRFEQAQEQTRTALFTALTEKYGKESFTIDPGFGKITRYWVRTPQGNLLEASASKGCTAFCQSCQAANSVLDNALSRGVGAAGQNDFIGRMAATVYMSSIDRPGMVPGNSEQCKTMTYVIAELSVTANRELVDQMQITVLDAGLDTRSREATRAFIKQSETATEKQRIETARQQPTPKL